MFLRCLNGFGISIPPLTIDPLPHPRVVSKEDSETLWGLLILKAHNRDSDDADGPMLQH